MPGKDARIVAIGDSTTEGFFVSDEETYPFILHQRLRGKYARATAVFNAARGGGSIDKELAILRDVALPLTPDVVLLAFCTNDISDLRNKSRGRLMSGSTGFNRRSLSVQRTFAVWCLTHSTLVETLMRFFWQRRFHGAFPAGVSFCWWR